jgi:transposase
MSYIQPKSRHQFMMPSCIEEYVSSDNPVRFIDVFVDKVIEIQPELLTEKGTSHLGRSAYPFSTLLKLYIYGFLNSITSSRKLENETYRNMEVIWLLGNLQPDHKTISDFRKDNKEAIRTVTLSFRRFLRDEGYITGKNMTTDSTKIKAYASKNTISLQTINKRMERIEAELDRYLNQLQENDRFESFEEQINELSQDIDVEPTLLKKIASLQSQVEELEKHKRFLEASGREAYAPSDPEAKIMKTTEGFLPAYSAQSSTDNEHHMIAHMDVTDEYTDYDCLEGNVDALEEQIDIVPEELAADKGFANEDQIRNLEKRGVRCFIPFPEQAVYQRQIEAGISFEYDEENDCFHCSEGQTLPLQSKLRIKRGKPYAVYQGKNCDECLLRAKCTKSKKGRIIHRRLDDEWLRSYKEKLKTPYYQQKIKERKNYVEHPFGTIKYWMGKIPLLLRGKEKVQVEIDLYATCYNLKRLMNIEPMDKLIQKITNWGKTNLIEINYAKKCFF